MKKSWLVVGSVVVSAVLYGGYAWARGQPLADIEGELVGKTSEEKAEIKSEEIVKVLPKEKRKEDKNGLQIEVIDRKVLSNGMLEVTARAWQDGDQIGFGPDGTVDIERFKFYNPPVLIEDPSGTIERTVDLPGSIAESGTTVTVKFKEDPEEALIQALTHTIGIVGKAGDNIETGKIGNTTGTFYSVAGENDPVDGDVGCSNCGNWAATRGAATGTHTNDTATNERCFTEVYTGKGYISRVFTLFDLSSIPAGSTLSSATYSFVCPSGGCASRDNSGEYWNVIQTSPASDNVLVTADYDAVTFTSYGESQEADSITDDGSTYEDITINATGLTYISGTFGGTCRLGGMCRHDLNNDAPNSPTNDNGSWVDAYMADQTGTSKDLKLVLEYTAASTDDGFRPSMMLFGWLRSFSPLAYAQR